MNNAANFLLALAVSGAAFAPAAHARFGNQPATMPISTQPLFGNHMDPVTPTQPLFGNHMDPVNPAQPLFGNRTAPVTSSQPLFGNHMAPVTSTQPRFGNQTGTLLGGKAVGQALQPGGLLGGKPIGLTGYGYTKAPARLQPARALPLEPAVAPARLAPLRALPAVPALPAPKLLPVRALPAAPAPRFTVPGTPARIEQIKAETQIKAGTQALADPAIMRRNRSGSSSEIAPR